MGRRVDLSLREELAASEHDRWSRWMEHVFKVSFHLASGDVIIPKSYADGWKRQIATQYAGLSEHEKDSDREEADRTIAIFEEHK